MTDKNVLQMTAETIGKDLLSALVTEIKLKAMTLTRNGLCLYDRTRLP